MNNTLRFRSIFTLVAALFLTIGVNAQTGMSNSKKKSSKTEKKASEKTESATDDTEENDEIVYFYSYLVVELSKENEMYNVSMDKSAFEGDLKLPQDQMQMAKKAASGNMQYRSETEFLNYMANSDYELVSVTSEQSGKKSKMYFRLKLER